ncbi:relaxase/mobilization nuclease domain-containing protein [Kineococcus sp. NUM-3379]
MIAKVMRGEKVGGLLRYLYGPGRANEHTNPHLIAGFDDPTALEVPVTERGERDFRSLIAALEAPLTAAGVGPDKKPVYHLIVSAAKANEALGQPADRRLSDAEWREVCEDLMDRTDLAPTGDDAARPAPVRWIAVRHDDAHVHLVATLAREDGTRAWPKNDFYRLREGCRAAEAKYGLASTAPADRTAPKRATRAETEKAQRTGQREPHRVTLAQEVRSAAATASNLDGFFDQLADAGIMVRRRYSTREAGQITGYSVAMPTILEGGDPIWFSGGKLSSDLTLPKISARFEMDRVGDKTAAEAPGRRANARTGADKGRAHRVSPEERERIWARVHEATAHATETISTHGTSDPRQAADAAWAAADFLSAAAEVLEGRRGGPLTDAAGSYLRAAKEVWGRTPPPSSAGRGLREAASWMTLARAFSRSNMAPMLQALAQMAVLSDALVRLREEQDRAHQAAAARRAAEQLRATVGHYGGVLTANPPSEGDAFRRTEVGDEQATGVTQAQARDRARRATSGSTQDSRPAFGVPNRPAASPPPAAPPTRRGGPRR